MRTSSISRYTNNRYRWYEQYRNKLNHALRMTERNYYQDLISEHKANVKQSWQVIESVINKRKYKPINTEFNCSDEIT